MSTMKITNGASISGNLLGGSDKDNDFTLIDLSGSYILDAKGGNDRLILGEASANFTVSPPESNGNLYVSNDKVSYYLMGFESIVFTDKTILLGATVAPVAPGLNTGGSANPVNGTAGNDHLAGSSSNESIDGGAGIDTLVLSNVTRAAVTMTNNKDGSWSMSGPAVGMDTLRNVERVAFADRVVALDTQADGNAGKTMQFIGAVAPALLGDLGARGVIISQFDQGYSMLQLAQAALDLNLVAHNTHRQLAGSTYQKVVGVTADEATLSALTQYIDFNGKAAFISTVAELSLNVDLLGLGQSGMEYYAV